MKKQINILFDASILANYFKKDGFRSGVFFAAYNVLKEFERRQIFNIILSFSHYQHVHKMKKDPFFSKFSFITFFSKQEFFNNIKLHKNNIKVTFNIFKKLFFTYKIFKHCLYAFFYYLIDYIHNNNNILKNIDVFFSPVSTIDQRIIKYTHIKKYFILHDIMPLLFPEYYPTFFFTNDYINEFARSRSLNKEYYYFCNSENTKLDYLKYYSDQLDEKKIIVIHHASSQNFFPNYDKIKLIAVFKKYKVEYNKNNNYIFSFCTLEPRKNLSFTMSCFIKFIKKNNINNLYYYLGGGQWNEFIHLLEEQIDNFNEYSDKIVRLGYIDDEDVNILYSNSLFFTYISQYEGFGVPALEAMQSGTPVITSNNSSLPEVVGDAAIMIYYNNEEQCIKAFEDLYFNKDLRNYYINRGLEQAKLFSWEKTVDKMSDEIINNIV